jgi:hypothetical protein
MAFHRKPLEKLARSMPVGFQSLLFFESKYYQVI